MAYFGSEAYRLDDAERARRPQAAGTRFDVLEGGGADARARQGVSPVLLARVKVAAAALAVFVVLGGVRVALTAATVTELTANVQLETSIEEAAAANSDLRVERSILSSSARIDRIAVQNYGMVAATEHASVTLPESSADAQAEEGEVGADTDSGVPADQASFEK